MANFDISIMHKIDKQYGVRVENAPGGGATDAVSVTIDEEDARIAPILAQLAELKLRVRPPEDLEVLGQWLTGRLLPDGEVRALYNRSLGYVDREGERLSIRLHVPAELVGIPWEYAWDPITKNFLLLNERVLFMRRPSQMAAVRVQEVAKPLKLLLVISDPVDAPPLDVMRELDGLHRALDGLLEDGELSVSVMFGGRDANRQQIEAAVAGWPGVELLATALSPNELVFALQRQVHILHYIGHGSNDPKRGAILWLTNEQGRKTPFGAENMRNALAGTQTLGVVYLNACETATPNTGRELLSMADALVEAQVPAVVAMQYAVPDQAAANFARAFYQAVAGDEPLHLALTKGRRAVSATSRRLDKSWGIPVLYLRAEDGIVWQMEGGGEMLDEEDKEKQAGDFSVSAGRDITGGQFIQAGDDAEIHYTEGDRLYDQARKIDTGGGDYVEHAETEVHVEGGGIAAGGDLTIGAGSTVAGRDIHRGDDISIGGDIGPGAAVGSGASVQARDIAGGDIIRGEVSRDTLKSLGLSQEDIDELRDELEALRGDLQEIEDQRLARKALRRLEQMEKALGLSKPDGAVNLRQFRRRAEWLIENVPEFADSVQDVVDLVDEFVNR